MANPFEEGGNASVNEGASKMVELSDSIPPVEVEAAPEAEAVEEEQVAEPTEEVVEGEAEGQPAPDQKDLAIQALREQIAKLSAMLYGAVPQSQQREVEEEPVEEAPKRPKVAELTKFIESEEDMSEALSDPVKLNNLLTNVYAKAFQDILKVVPSVIRKQVDVTVRNENKFNKFLSDNPDISSFADYVRMVGSELYEGHKKDWDEGKIFKETAKEVRKRLGLSDVVEGRKIVSVNKSTVRKPLMASGSGARPTAGKPSGLNKTQLDIAKMISAAEKELL